jgi:hypothetical protein
MMRFSLGTGTSEKAYHSTIEMSKVNKLTCLEHTVGPGTAVGITYLHKLVSGKSAIVHWIGSALEFLYLQQNTRFLGVQKWWGGDMEEVI